MWRVQLMLAVIIVLAGFGIIAMTAVAGPLVSYLYYEGLILITIFCTFARLRVSYAVTSRLINLIAYEVTAIAVSRSPGAILTNNTFFLLASAVVGMGANYSMEINIRRTFVQERIIAARTKELQEKNEELSAKNRELVQSREELLRSAKRTELVFAALADALPGTVLDDKYRLEEKVGSGGFGTVYRATHIHWQSPVAVKVFRPSLGSQRTQGSGMLSTGGDFHMPHPSYECRIRDRLWGLGIEHRLPGDGALRGVFSERRTGQKRHPLRFASR
jgi:hypothetical protein